MGEYLERDNYEAACLAMRDAGTIAAQAVSEGSRPDSEKELEALRIGLYYAAESTAAQTQSNAGAGDRDRAMAAALGLMAADEELLNTHLQMVDQMGGSPEAIGESLGRTCNISQSTEYKRNLALQMLVIYERLFAS